MGNKDELTERQRRFLEEYLAGGDAFEAAVSAGYSPASARAQGKRLLRDPRIQQARRELEQELFEELGVSPAWIGRRLVEIVDRCMQAVPHLSRNPATGKREPDGTWEFDPTGALRALHELDEHIRALREEGEGADEGPAGFEEWLSEQYHSGQL